MQKISIILLIAVLLSACANIKKTSKFVDSDQNGISEKSVVNIENLSQKTLRYQEKVTLAKALCSSQSENHNAQRIVTKTSPVVIVDGKAVKMPDSAATIFYNPSIAPFNMIGCIEESLRWGGERLAQTIVAKATQIIGLGIKGFAAVEIAKKVFDSRGVKINGTVEKGATVAVSGNNSAIDLNQSDNRKDQAGDGSTFGTCNGEIVEGKCVNKPATTETETGTGTGTGTEENSDGLFGLQPDGRFAGSGERFCTPEQASENNGDCPQ